MERQLIISLNSSEDLQSFTSSFQPHIFIIYHQENRHYTSSLLENKSISLRLRCQNDQFILTERTQFAAKDGYFQCDKTNELLSIKSFDEFKSKQYPDLQLQAIIKTVRTVIKFGKYCFECDNTTTILPNKHNIFQIECETDNPDEVRKIIYDVLEEKGIQFQLGQKTKLCIAMTENL